MGNVNSDNRIIYVEPNDVYGQVNGKPMTPDYTDYCIYCNLIVEKTSRLKNDYAGNSSDSRYGVISDGSNKGVLYTSFFRGESEKYNYLTTDYTNIHFNSIKKQTFVEGLQITGIDINYANRMSPMVTMQMVDVRGSGLFGREESTHTANGISNLEKDEEDNIIDNIYSGFMCFPYPRYKLQIKGFYGRAVTYQLSCSNFIGKFDSSTGNYNITVTFIGYEYGCLQDIPLSYVMAAPFTKTGHAYWEKHKNSPEWNLFMNSGQGSEPPMLLHDFLRNIKSAIDNKTDGESLLSKLSDTSFEDIDGYSEKKSCIDKIVSNVNSFVQELKKANSSADIIDIPEGSTVSSDKNGDKVIMIFNANSTLLLNKYVTDLYNAIGNSIDAYVSAYSHDGVGLNFIPNNIGGKWNNDTKWEPKNAVLPLFLKLYNNRKLVAVSSSKNNFEKQISIGSGDGQEFDDARLQIGMLNTDSTYTFNSEQSVRIYEHIKNSEAIKKGEKGYCSVVVFKHFSKLLNIVSELEKKKKEYENIGNSDLVSIKNITGGGGEGITPYIGNYYKMLFCHIDTFIYTMWKCVDDIYGEINKDDRNPSKLGIRCQSETDVPSDIYGGVGVGKGCIPPFPGIYSNYDSDEVSLTEQTNDVTKKIGWVGNVKGVMPWREEAFVNEYYKALKIIDNETSGSPWTDIDNVNLVFNPLPCFIDDEQNKGLFYTIDGITYYIAIMSELVLGAMNANGVKITAEEAKGIGGVFAYNLFDACSDKEKLKRTVSGGDFANTVYKSSTLTGVDANDEAKLFEFADGTETDKRHRIFVEEDGKLKYSYMRSNSGDHKPIIPIDSFNSWDELQSRYTFDNHGITTFIPKKFNDGDYVFTERGKEFVQASRSHDTKDSDEVEYMNSNMFSIWLDACNVQGIELDYDEYVDGGANIGDYTKDYIKKHILQKYWLMNDNFEKYYKVKPEDFKKMDFEIPDYTKDSPKALTGDIKDKLLKLKH